MLAGVTIVDPASTWIDVDVSLEADATIHPFTVLRGSTAVASGAQIGPHVVAVDSAIGEGALVGPFCYLRPGTVLDPGAKAGTFVEMKNSRIGARTKVPHLSYIGDADIGEDTNVARRQRHRELLPPPWTAEGEDDDRQERQDRGGQYVRCSGHGWRRCLGFDRDGRHRRRPAGIARRVRTEAGNQGRMGLRAWKARRTWRRLSSPGSRGSRR